MFDGFKIALSSTFEKWMGSFNDLLAKLDELPLPVGFGSNSQMDYLKLANGTVLMWGAVSHGQNYPCGTHGGGGEGYYTSKSLTVNFPLPLVSESPTVITSVRANEYADVFFLQRTATYTNFTGCYYCRYDDSAVANNKDLNVLVIGRWK